MEKSVTVKTVDEAALALMMIQFGAAQTLPSFNTLGLAKALFRVIVAGLFKGAMALSTLAESAVMVMMLSKLTTFRKSIT